MHLVILRSIGEYIDKTDESSNEEYNSFRSNRSTGVDSLWFIAASSIFLLLLFVFIYYLPVFTSGMIQEVLSTGIHVPLLLGGAGVLLSKYKPQLSSEIKKNTFLVVSIALNINFIVLNWKIALFVLSLILGKYIWIDFVFDSQNILHSLAIFQKSTDVCALLIKTYGSHSVALFYIMFLFYAFCDYAVNIPSEYMLFTMIIAYISMFMCYVSFLSRFNP